MYGVEELQSSTAAWVSTWVLGRIPPSLPHPLPPLAPHLRAGPGSGAPRTAQASERLCSQRRQQLPHQLGAQHLKGRRGAVERQTGTAPGICGTPLTSASEPSVASSPPA